MATIKQITSDELKSLLASQDVLLVDVREVNEFAQGTIPGAVNMPLSQFSDNISALLSDVSKPLVIFCQGGKRSMIACKKLIDAGYKQDVYNLEGGILAW